MDVFRVRDRLIDDYRDFTGSFVDIHEPQGRNWDDARKFGFVSAGGGAWFTRTLRGLPVGGRVFVHIPQVGYVGTGTVIGEATRFDDATVVVAGQPQKLAELLQAGRYHHTEADDEDTAEYVVPVEWSSTRPREQAVRRKGMFANQNSACKLRNRFTLDALYSEFGIDDADAGQSEL